MKPIRVLLVDDDDQIRASLGAWLHHCGFSVVAVDGPIPADRALGSEPFDLILSDVCMPGNTRLRWVQRRLASECLPPILLMTGSPEIETAIRAVNLPVAGYLLKPLDPKHLRDRIEYLAGDYRRRLEFLSLSHEVLRLLTLRISAPSDPPDRLVLQLHLLACELSAESRRRPRESLPPIAGARWHDALLDTIRAIERVGTDCRTAEILHLYQRLVSLVDPALQHCRYTPPVPVNPAFDPSQN